MSNLSTLYTTIQRNCHISDGNFAQDYGLCTYLLKMRQLYRWEKKLPLTAKLSQQDIGDWLVAREQLWEQLADESFACIPVADKCYDPFDTMTINQVLLPYRLIYSAGYGHVGKPLFVIGQLHQHEWREGLEIFILAEEYARDLAAPPAMSQNNMIFIRQEALRQTLWENIEAWHWQKANHHFDQLLEIYHAQQNLEIALDKMVADEIASLIYHEIGEVKASQLLGEDWEKMLITIAGTKAEWLARAVRDHLADCLVTLPQLLDQAQAATLLLYLVNLKGLRKALFPSLFTAFQSWLQEKNNRILLQQVVKKGQNYWLNVAQSLLDLYQTHPQEECTLLIIQRMEQISL
jgi:hypothetical protein